MLRQRGGRNVRRMQVQLAYRAGTLHQRAQDQEPVFIGEKSEKLRNSFRLLFHNFSPSFRF